MCMYVCVIMYVQWQFVFVHISIYWLAKLFCDLKVLYGIGRNLTSTTTVWHSPLWHAAAILRQVTRLISAEIQKLKHESECAEIKVYSAPICLNIMLFIICSPFSSFSLIGAHCMRHKGLGCPGLHISCLLGPIVMLSTCHLWQTLHLSYHSIVGT